jgi:release factor glutamine methyltransferase
MTISEMLRSGAEILQSGGILQPRREAASLLAFALQKDKTFLVAHSEYEPSKSEENCFREFLRRRAGHEPFQYIVGKQEFYGLDFAVSPDVLIPRPETELIVENAIEILREIEKPRFCEVGVGSGCISVATLHNLKTAEALGLDVSERALKIARKNAEAHQAAERLKLEISNVFEVLNDEKFDLIVSNPPYISSEDVKTLQAEVRDFEPFSALSDGKDGFSIIEQIIKDAPKFLRKRAFLLMEIGFKQAEKVEKMFRSEIWREVEFLPDLQSIPRVIKAQIGGR